MQEAKPLPVEIVEPARAPAPHVSLGDERGIRLKPLMGIPAPREQTHASAVPAYSAPLSFDWRKPLARSR
jgi:hypothetical protein